MKTWIYLTDFKLQCGTVHHMFLFTVQEIKCHTGQRFGNKYYMQRKHIRETVNGFLITLYWTKTIQAGERCLEFPLLEAPGSPLCPMWAIRNMIKLVPASEDSPAFCYTSGQPIAYSTFNNFLKSQIRKLWNVR